MVSAEILSENVCALHPINEWNSGRYFLRNSLSEGFQKVLYFRLRKSNKRIAETFSLFFFLVSTFKRANVFLN